MEQLEAVIVGGGQAGLAGSRELLRLGVEHVVLERGRIGQTWRDRWDSFCLVSPNWTVQLPDRPYDGDDPDGFMPRDEIVSYLSGTRRRVRALPVRKAWMSLSVESGRPSARTIAGELQASALVLRPAPTSARTGRRGRDAACGPARHRRGRLPQRRRAASRADLGGGSGQSGCQLVEEPRTRGASNSVLRQ